MSICQRIQKNDRRILQEFYKKSASAAYHIYKRTNKRNNKRDTKDYGAYAPLLPEERHRNDTGEKRDKRKARNTTGSKIKSKAGNRINPLPTNRYTI